VVTITMAIVQVSDWPRGSVRSDKNRFDDGVVEGSHDLTRMLIARAACTSSAIWCSLVHGPAHQPDAYVARPVDRPRRALAGAYTSFLASDQRGFTAVKLRK